MLELSKIKSCLTVSKLSKNGTLIKCFTDHSLLSRFLMSKIKRCWSVSQPVGEWQGHLLSCSRQLKHRKNCECCHHHSLFKGHNVIVHIVVLNCQKCNQCLKCHVSGHKNFQKFSKIVTNCQKLSKIVKNCQNCQKLSKLSKLSKIVKIVKMLVRSCFLITVIKCLKGHWSLGLLFNVKKQKWLSESVSEWVTRSPIELSGDS